MQQPGALSDAYHSKTNAVRFTYRSHGLLELKDRNCQDPEDKEYFLFNDRKSLSGNPSCQRSRLYRHRHYRGSRYKSPLFQYCHLNHHHRLVRLKLMG